MVARGKWGKMNEYEHSIVEIVNHLLVRHPQLAPAIARLATTVAAEHAAPGQDIFTQIYNQNFWGDGESKSGPGSTFAYTMELREKLPQLLQDFGVDSIFDAPCGDFNWMQHVVAGTGIRYLGGDIVEPLIEDLRTKYSGENINFVRIDLAKDPFPYAKLMICRDCIFHLSYQDASRLFHSFVNSKIDYLLTSTHVNPGVFQNRDIMTGDYRQIDLFSAPYNFPRDVLFRISDWVPPHSEREMCLWSRDQVAAAIEASL
jgi:hypothetical protein